MSSDDTITLVAVGIGVVALIFSLIAVVNVPTIYNLNDGLVLWLPLNDGIGNASDYSGLLNHGLISGALWVDGKFGKGLSFDGSNDYVEVSCSASLNITNEITLVMWYKAVSGDIAGFEKTNAYFLYWQGSAIYGRAFPNGVFAKVCTSDDGLWHFVVYTYKRNSVQCLYFDGVLVKSASVSDTGITLNDRTFRLGYVYDDVRKCVIDDIRVYNRALTINEISLLYNNTQNMVVP